MNCANFCTGKIIWFVVIYVTALFTLYLVLYNASVRFCSFGSSTKTSFSGGTGKYAKIKLQPDVLISKLQVGRARYDNQRIVCT